MVKSVVAGPVNCPAAHVVQYAWPAEAWNCPCGQSVHADAAVAPTTADDLPALQAKQSLSAVFPVPTAYLPALHSMQWVLSELAVVVTYLPELHAMHEEDPAVLWYFPTSQLLQVELPCEAA